MSLRALYNVPAPAKLNLFLHIVGRRADGYHLLESLFVLIDWADELHFELRDDGQLIRHDLGPALPADDLCQRAARALQRASGGNLGADIYIHKHVPWGAGMGGGSSDAATTLLALNRLWGLHWPREKLAQIGLTLGADVPFFIGGQNALVQGIGEQLWPVHVPPAHYAVLKPPVSLATREIFEHPGLVRDTKTVIVAGSLEGAGCSEDLASGLDRQNRPAQVWSGGFGKNDLQAAAEDCCAEVAQAARWLEARYGNSRMTGSGSAVFSRVGAPSQAPESPGLFSTAGLGPNWLGRMCRSLDQHPLRAWAD
jgi:4-diphosphocytidyl-2-C-methyl-D-erythritol kinase